MDFEEFKLLGHQIHLKTDNFVSKSLNLISINEMVILKNTILDGNFIIT